MNPSRLDAQIMWGHVSLLRYEVKDLFNGIIKSRVGVKEGEK